MNKTLEIKSGVGIYKVEFVDNALLSLKSKDREKTQLIVDQNVYKLYENKFKAELADFKITLVEAIEPNKNVDKASFYAKLLMENKVKIDHTLIAIGGGIVQDITCFLASTMFRGMQWEFFPTTLLAQADSCIGSKSSINVGEFKNLMGTFYPPKRILLDLSFLNTLPSHDILSGIGEILKVHMIKGKEYFEKACHDYSRMIENREVLKEYIWNSLLYKREMIELDEYDKGPRNVMNYGHSFGHAIEAATNFGIPHGIAVSLGMDMANYQASLMGRITHDDFLRWHQTLKKNYANYLKVEIPLPLFISAIAKDKKNIGADLSLILVQNQGPIQKVKVKKDEVFEANCKSFFKEWFK